MQWPTTVARRGAVPLLVRRKMNGCSLFGCSARSNRLRENGCPDFSLLPLLGADEQIFGVNEQILFRADPQRPKNIQEYSTSGAVHSSAAGRKFVFTLRTVAAAEVVHDGVEAESASLAQSSELLAWPSMLPCIGGTGEKAKN